MGSRRLVGVVAVIAGLAMVLASLVAPSPVAATGYVLALNNQSAPAGTDCPDALNDYWHFIIAPNSGGYAFVSITLNVGGTSYTFTGGQIIPNGIQTDNVFVAVPAGKTLGQVLASGSTATISAASTPPDNVKFVLSHLCDGSGPTTTTTIAPTTTTTIAPTTTTIAPTTTTIAPTTTTIAPTTTTIAPTTTTTVTTTTAPTTTLVTTTTEQANEVVTTTTEQASEAVTTTTLFAGLGPVPTTTVGRALPVTGNGEASSEMVLLGFLLMGLGSVVLLLSRRPIGS